MGRKTLHENIINEVAFIDLEYVCLIEIFVMLRFLIVYSFKIEHLIVCNFGFRMKINAQDAR